MRYFLTAFVLIVIATAFAMGFRGQRFSEPPIEVFPDMDRQGKFRAQHRTEFFADGRADRPAVAGTVPQQMPRELDYKATGRFGENWGDGIPLEVTADFLKRGKERYNIHCAICHGASGNGKGVVAQYEGMAGLPANFHTDRIRKMSDGELYHVITYGRGTMGPYGYNVKLEDRWAIVAYMRALQRSQFATIEDVPEDRREELDAEEYE